MSHFERKRQYSIERMNANGLNSKEIDDGDIVDNLTMIKLNLSVVQKKKTQSNM